MSKIELTEYQAQELHTAWCAKEGVGVECYGATLDRAIELGLVRPATDDLDRTKEVVCQHQNKLNDLAARVAALEALVGNSHPHEIDFPTRLATLEAWRHSMMQDKACPPDPHAAAKDRAKLWGVELVTLKDGTCLFMTEKHYLSNPKPSWFPHVFSFRSPHYSGGHKTLSDAWSNFTTEPPPGWEAPTGVTVNLPLGQHTVTVPFDQPPRTEADRLGDVLFSQFCTGFNWNDAEGRTKLLYCNAALAVRKAVLAAQLEPSEEEVDKACNAYLPHYAASTPGVVESVRRGVTAALIAAARVRLEKAEGEKP